MLVSMMMDDCIFCRVVSGDAEASLVYEDDRITAFMSLYPLRPGTFLVVPNQHIDHFTDIPDSIAAHMTVIANRFARNAMERLLPRPLRMGMVVHGFSVAHAHLVVVPMHDSDDLTSKRYMAVKDGEIVDVGYTFDVPPRSELDAMAQMLRDE